LAPAGQGFDAFVVGAAAGLLRLAYLLTRERGLAEDLVQESLVKMYRRWDRMHLEVANPDGYARRIVVNEFLSQRRRKASSETVGYVPDERVGAAAEVPGSQDDMWVALAGLPARQRAVLVLRYYEDMRDDDIAAVLRCAAGTVRSLAARAFTTLRVHPQFESCSRSIVPREAT
jgi:RNA polymerase sigma-70 factor (sigma-E family)